MRLAWLALVIGACGTDEGSLLEISAPDGPENVARLEIVLANPDKIETVEDQRLAPRDFAGTEDVRYYRQRATAGVIVGVGRADGFVLRLEPNIASVPEKIFVPFLVAYDAQDNVIGVGAVLDENHEPTSITIEGGMTRKYFVVSSGCPGPNSSDAKSGLMNCAPVPPVPCRISTALRTRPAASRCGVPRVR